MLDKIAAMREFDRPKHTPGPWSIGSVVGYPNAIGIGSPTIVILNQDSLESPERQEANVRLIAASPDLLVELQFAANFIAECQQSGCPAGPVAIPSRITDAITKAGGEIE